MPTSSPFKNAKSCLSLGINIARFQQRRGIKNRKAPVPSPFQNEDYEVPKNQYSAEYCTSKVAGIPLHVLGAAPPAVLTLYTSFTPPRSSAGLTLPFGVCVCSFSHGTGFEPSGPLLGTFPGFVAGAVTFAIFLLKVIPKLCVSVCRLNVAVVKSLK